ncbi:hypothetical protein DFJ73DRAFT_80476 [Zopfochytrium polystomum]|nr:hypothetical protein DFJ73DRAFT_80476 [Zopfochytrium polystomum]
MPPSSRQTNVYRHDQDSLVLFSACYISFVCTGVFPSPEADSTLRLAATIDRVVSATASPSATLLVSLIYLERLRSSRASQARLSSSDVRAAWRVLQNSNSPEHIAMFTGAGSSSSSSRRHHSNHFAAKIAAKAQLSPSNASSVSSDSAITPTVSARLHRIWSAAFILADAFMNDNAFTCQSWSIVTDYTPNDCVSLKRCFLMCLDHDVWIKPGEYRAWVRMFKERVRTAGGTDSDASSSTFAFFTKEMSKGLERAASMASAAAAKANDELGAEAPATRHTSSGQSKRKETAAVPSATVAHSRDSTSEDRLGRRISTVAKTQILPQTMSSGAERSSITTSNTAVITAATNAITLSNNDSHAGGPRRPSFITTTAAAAEAATLASMRRRSSLLSSGTSNNTPVTASGAAPKNPFLNPLPTSSSSSTPRRMSSTASIASVGSKRMSITFDAPFGAMSDSVEGSFIPSAPPTMRRTAGGFSFAKN